ncbi:MAG: glycoside hydrolase family 88 protein [Lentisphaerae bacterium]|nr:glycoside hydrolase family 88 protein [Lentisphaerota bacterium]
MKIDEAIVAADLKEKLARFWELSGQKIQAIESDYDTGQGAPVFTVNGKYTARGWTEWTQGFQYGSAILQFDATGDTTALENGRRNTLERMAPHVTHFGVHDHGFNNVSTYGNLWRLMNEGRLPENAWERAFYELAIKSSGAVQARRWTELPEGLGYVYSFNGPHSLFADTIRSMRALALSHQLGHAYCGENDVQLSLMERLVKHVATTARYIIYYGEGRDTYDICGRAAHEAIFNLNDGAFRCPSSQQGYSPFSTWTRGHAWVMLGFAEQLEFLDTLPDDTPLPCGGRAAVRAMMLKAATATCDFYIAQTPLDGIVYWDTGAPGLARMGDYLERPAEPFNAHEPVDSSASAIAAQGLLRLGHLLGEQDGGRYTQAGLTVLARLLDEPYLSTDSAHQGLLLHSIYHRPNGWDHIPEGQTIPCGESSMWGDYHIREAALLAGRIGEGTYYRFF